MGKTRGIRQQGYTLVEMIIVIAIIAVVSAMSFVTVGIIHTANAKEAALVLDAEIGELKSKCRSVTSGNGSKLQITVNGASETADGYVGRIFYDTSEQKNRYCYQIGYVKYDSSGQPTYIWNAKDAKENTRAFSSTVSIRYTKVPSRGSVSDPLTEKDIKDIPGGVYIMFKRNGEAFVDFGTGASGDDHTGDGPGIYTFYKSNGSQVAKDYIRLNGSHQSR